jgi:hypothetical protein
MHSSGDHREPAMTVTPLDPRRHRMTQVGAFPDFAHAGRQQHVILGWSEIALAAADYPLALLKHSDTGQFNVVALYGFSADRNLYITGSHWHATYVPQNSLRYPFFANSAGALGLAIDERSELIGAAEGQRLFDGTGQPTPYTVQIANAIQGLRRDFEDMREFVNALIQLQLVRPLEVILRMADGAESRIEGLFSISDQAQSSLPDHAVVALHRQSYLQALSILMASLVQINRLQQLYNAQSPLAIREVELLLSEARS